MVKTLILASLATTGLALAPQKVPAQTSVVGEGRRAFMTQVAGVAAAAGLAPSAAFADGAVSAATVARSRGIYGGRILDLKGAVEKGDFAAVMEEKNAFELFNSGAYMTKGPKNKELKAKSIAEYNNIAAACKAGDKAALKTAYAAYVKNADITSSFGTTVMDGQGYSNDYDWKVRTNKGTIYQR